MISNLTTIMQVLPLIAMMALTLHQSHLLMTLLSLEGVMLTMVLFIPFSLSLSNMPLVTMSIVFLSFGACEASLGLSLMVIMARSYGSDLISSLTLNKC